MAPKHPKSKGTHSDVQFFEIENGKVSPAKDGATTPAPGKTPPKPPPGGKSDTNRFLSREPVFTLDEDVSRINPLKRDDKSVSKSLDDKSRSQVKIEPGSQSIRDFPPMLPEIPDSIPDLTPFASAGDAEIVEQIDLLKPQIDDISRMPDAQDLTSDQTDVLRKYISLKEAEVRDLRDQHRQYQAFFKKVSSQIEQLTRRNRDLTSNLDNTRRREDAVRVEYQEVREKFESELALLKNDYEEKLRKGGNYEAQVESLMHKREEWRDKVAEDLKRIKLKEREMENKYELLKRDTQALLDSKDKHVLELKKKNDALELEQEALEERLRRANTILAGIDSKKKRLLETLKLTTTLLEEIDNLDREDREGKE